AGHSEAEDYERKEVACFTSTSLDNTELLVKPYIRPFHRFFWRVHDLDLHLSPQERASARLLSSFGEQTGSIPSLCHGFDNQDARQAIQLPPCHPDHFLACLRYMR